MLSGLPGFGGKSAASSTPSADGTDAAGEKSSDWSLHLGPLSLGSEGVSLKPQLKVGGHVKNFKAEAGLSDVRNGLKVSAKAEAEVVFKSKGQNVAELHDNIHCDTPGFREALEAAKQILGATVKKAEESTSGLAKLAQALKTDSKTLELLFAGKAPVPGEEAASGRPPMALKVKASTGVGAGAEVRLGWCDTDGYHMVGVGGQAAAGISVGCTIFAGRHSEGASVRIILGISNFEFEYTFPVGGKLGLPSTREGEDPGVPVSTAAAPPLDLLS
mmetsp:Transcript_51984/g.111231  ORF Transcript_51984/g.111231 Transcript_51984/m.111231 type:complete len:274 (-) Transcript_51984:217-1038(-)